MASKCQVEECLKATVISQVRVVYGPKYPAGSVFDVVYSAQVKNPTQYTSHVVVYPETKPFSAGEVVSGECVEILRSREHGEIWATYSHLIHYLGHTKIRGVLDDQHRQGSNEAKVVR